jgi:hypothetical protein
VGYTRNYILKHTPNRYNQAEHDSLAAKLHWYRENRHHVLSAEDSHLADHDTDAIARMGHKLRRKWVQQLDSLNKAFTKDQSLNNSGQTAITKHFKVVSPKTPRMQRIAQRHRQPAHQPKYRQMTLNVTKTKKATRSTPRYTSPVVTRRKPGSVITITPDTATTPLTRDLPRPPETGNG